MADITEYEARLDAAELQLSRLKALYEQWFRGFEKLPPTVQLKKFSRELQWLTKYKPRKAGLRFRFQTLVQRYTTLQSYWRRITREIEEGTYKRDVDRARRRRQEALAEQRRERAADRAAERARQDEDASQRGPASAAEGAAGPARPAAASESASRPEAGLDDARMRDLYDRFIEARRRNHEPTDTVTYDKLKRSIDKMLPQLEAKRGGKPVDFEVVVRDGRVGLKPVARD